MSKYCTKCGCELNDNASFCTNCGSNQNNSYNNTSNKNDEGFLMASFILMIISCISYGIFLIPLAWLIPMTISIKKRMDGGPQLSTSFKVCTLLFGNQIAGILLLCDNNA